MNINRNQLSRNQQTYSSRTHHHKRNQNNSYSLYPSAPSSSSSSRSNTSSINSFNEIRSDNAGNQSVYIDSNYRPNDLILDNAKIAPTFSNSIQSRTVSRMTDNTYDDCNNTFSQYRRSMILEMANSIVKQSDEMFNDENENEYYENRPYEEQTQYQPSKVGSRQIKRMAKNIVSRYSNDYE